jgi:hypothetical protein
MSEEGERSCRGCSSCCFPGVPFGLEPSVHNDGKEVVYSSLFSASSMVGKLWKFRDVEIFRNKRVETSTTMDGRHETRLCRMWRRFTVLSPFLQATTNGNLVETFGQPSMNNTSMGSAADFSTHCAIFASLKVRH